jgi:hypothetical protein
MIKIENTELYKKTKSVLNDYWCSNKDDLQYEFCIHLIQYACGKYYDYKRVNKKKAHSLKAFNQLSDTNKMENLNY